MGRVMGELARIVSGLIVQGEVVGISGEVWWGSECASGSANSEMIRDPKRKLGGREEEKWVSGWRVWRGGGRCDQERMGWLQRGRGWMEGSGS